MSGTTLAMCASVIVPGYGGRFRLVERWRVTLALRTVRDLGGGTLVVSGMGGEAQRMAGLVPDGIPVVVEPTARSTFENVERSLALIGDPSQIAIASDRLHSRRCAAHLRELRPDLAALVVRPSRSWRSDWWMDAASAPYEIYIRARRALHRP